MGSGRGHLLTLGREGSGKTQGRGEGEEGKGKAGGSERCSTRDDFQGVGQGRGTNNGVQKTNALVALFHLSKNYLMGKINM